MYHISTSYFRFLVNYHEISLSSFSCQGSQTTSYLYLWESHQQVNSMNFCVYEFLIRQWKLCVCKTSPIKNSRDYLFQSLLCSDDMRNVYSNELTSLFQFSRLTSLNRLHGFVSFQISCKKSCTHGLHSFKILIWKWHIFSIKWVIWERMIYLWACKGGKSGKTCMKYFFT